jgi:DNA-binding transcriptional LysR family regulator
LAKFFAPQFHRARIVDATDTRVVQCGAMELRQLETFRIVMATLSMTEAAKRVYLSPAAVSLQMKRLSDELGADLFTRVGNKLVPTSAATRMHQHLGALMDMVHTIREDFPADAGCDSRPFVLGTGPTTLIYQLRGPLSHLRNQFPRNEILVHVGPTQDIIYELEWKRIDLGIVSLPVEAPTLRLTPLFKEEMLVLMNARAAPKRGKTINLKDLVGIPMILYSRGSSTRTLIDAMMQKHRLSLRVTMEADDTEAIKKLVEAGFGASILPEKALQNSPLIRTFRIQDEPLYREIAFATPVNAHPRRLTTVITEYLRKRLLPRQTK